MIYSGYKNGKVDWPEHPRKGDKFQYICSIGGNDWVIFKFDGSKWVHVATR